MSTAEEIQHLREENTRLQDENVALRALIGQVQEQLTQLQERIRQLEKRKTPPPAFVKVNTPPPTVACPARQARAPEENGSRRCAPATRIVTHMLERCPECAYLLRGGHVAWTRQIIELPLPAPVEVVEHHVWTRQCPVCRQGRTPVVSFVGEVVGQSRCGVRLVSVVVYLHTVARLPVRTIQEVLRTLHGVDLSVGAITRLIQQVARQAQPLGDALRAEARASPVMHMDETGWREGGQNGYVWCLATPGPQAVRHYTYSHSRAGAVACAILGNAAGYVVSDFYGGYNGTPSGKHQRCWAHLLRDLGALREAHPGESELARSVRRWVRQVAALYRLACWGQRQDPRWSEERRRGLAHRLDDRAQELGCRYARTRGHPCRALAQRLLRHQGELFPFLFVDGLAPDNNLAERSIRPLVISRKISGGSRSALGSTTRMTLLSLCGTWRARGLNPFRECLALLSQKSPLPQL